MTIFDEYRAPAGKVAAWRALAGQVGEALEVAGIPHHREDDQPRPAGAEIAIDGFHDEWGGVVVEWRPGATLMEAVIEAARTGGTIPLYVPVTTAMRDAIMTVLRASALRRGPHRRSHPAPARDPCPEGAMRNRMTRARGR